MPQLTLPKSAAITQPQAPFIIVPASGPLAATIAIIGEAPGADEVKEGKPFVGTSGRLLDQCLRRANILRSLCYVTNVFKIRPPANDPSFFFTDKNMTQVKPQHQHFIDELHQELHKMPNLKIIIALGGTALWALTSHRAITKYRGSPMQNKDFPNAYIIPSYHPAACLRQWTWSHILTFDLTKANAILKNEIVPYEPREPVLPTQPSFKHDCIQYLTSITKGSTISVDIEIIGHQISCIGIAKDPHSCVVVPFHSSSAIHNRQNTTQTHQTEEDIYSYWSFDEEVSIWNILIQILEDKEIHKIFQNAMFDCPFFYERHNILVRGAIHDTMIQHHDCYPQLPKGLDFLTSIYLAETYYKDELKEWNQLRVDYVKLWEYNAKDAMYTFQIYQELQKEIKDHNIENVIAFDEELLETLMYMTLNGFRLDVKRMQELSTKLTEQADNLQIALDKTVGRNINVESPKQIRTLLYESPPIGFGFKARVHRKTGKTTADEDAILDVAKELSESDPRYQVLHTILDIRGIRKLVSTYLELRYSAKSRIHSVYNIGGTITGRLSSSKNIFGEGVQAHNVPKGIRDIFVADPGYILVNSDLSQAEARVVAALSRDTRLLSVFESGGDVHKANAATIFNVDIDNVTDEQRQLAKRVVHASNYGMGPITFAKTAGISTIDAKRLLYLYHSTFPGIHEWHRAVRHQLEVDRTLMTPFGRKLTFFDRWGEELFRAAYAFVPQSTVADALNRALMWIYRNVGVIPCLRSVIPLAQVHDNVVFQCKPEDLKEACLYIKDEMERPIRFTYSSGQYYDLVIPTSFEIGYDWKNLRKVLDISKIDTILDH